LERKFSGIASEAGLQDSAKAAVVRIVALGPGQQGRMAERKNILLNGATAGGET